MKIKRKQGGTEYIIALLILSLFFFSAAYTVKMREINVSKNQVKDSFTASMLASTKVKLFDYSVESLLLLDPNDAFTTFQKQIKQNLNLNDDMTPKDTTVLVNSPVIIKDFIVYNRWGTSYWEVTQYDAMGNITHSALPYNVRQLTPNNVTLQNSMVYCKIEFKVKGYFTDDITIEKEECVDVAT